MSRQSTEAHEHCSLNIDNDSSTSISPFRIGKSQRHLGAFLLPSVSLLVVVDVEVVPGPGLATAGEERPQRQAEQFHPGADIGNDEEWLAGDLPTAVAIVIPSDECLTERVE